MSDLQKKPPFSVKKISTGKRGIIKPGSVLSEQKIAINPVKAFIKPKSPLQTKSSASSGPSASAPSGPTPEEIYAKMQNEMDEKINYYKDSQINLVNSQLADIKKKARDEGFEQGKKEADDKFSKDMNTLLEQINTLGEQKQLISSESRPFIMSLTYAIAEKIITQEIEKDDAAFASIFDEAFQKITDKDSVMIVVNPEDEPVIHAYKKAFTERFKQIKQCVIKSSPDIQRGGCTIETKLGYVDATVQTKISLIKKAFAGYHDEDFEDQTDASLLDALEAVKHAQPSLSSKTDATLSPDEPMEEASSSEDPTSSLKDDNVDDADSQDAEFEYYDDDYEGQTLQSSLHPTVGSEFNDDFEFDTADDYEEAEPFDVSSTTTDDVMPDIDESAPIESRKDNPVDNEDPSIDIVDNIDDIDETSDSNVPLADIGDSLEANENEDPDIDIVDNIDDINETSDSEKSETDDDTKS